MRGYAKCVAAIAMALGATTSGGCGGGGGGGRSSPAAAVVGVFDEYNGVSYGLACVQWWNWWVQIPIAIDPLLDQTGENAGVNQVPPFFFLAPTLELTTYRDVTIPAGNALFFPIVFDAWASTNFIDFVTALEVLLDDFKVQGLDDRRFAVAQTGGFDGYWLMLRPLSRGLHTLRIRSVAFDAFGTHDPNLDNQVIYRLTIQ